MALGGGHSCGCGGDGGGERRLVVPVVFAVVFMAVSAPVLGQISIPNQGMFQFHASCGRESRIRHLVVNDPMWLRTGDEAVTLFPSVNPDKTCLLQPNTTHRVSAHISVDVRGEESQVLCQFPKEDVALRKGLLKVSCLKDRRKAEAEMLGPQESPHSGATTDSPATTPATSATTPATTSDTPLATSATIPATTSDTPLATSATTPATTSDTPLATSATTPASGTPPVGIARLGAGRDLGRQSTRASTVSTPSHEPLVSWSTPTPPASTRGTTMSSATPGKQTTTVTEITSASTTRTPATREAVAMTMLSGEVTETMTPAEATTDTLPDGTTTLTTPGSSGPQEAGATRTPRLPAGTQKPDLTKENISAPEPVKQTDGDDSGMSDDQMMYMAGAGAGVLALVLGVVVVVAIVAHHRRRQTRARAKSRQEEFFIGGSYKGSMHSLTHSGSGSDSERGAHLHASASASASARVSSGAYLNANIMYSGAEPEVAESFELEERILVNSGISYSTHDIPKCLK